MLETQWVDTMECTLESKMVPTLVVELELDLADPRPSCLFLFFL